MSGSYLLILVGGAAALLLWGTRMVRTGMTRAFGAEIRRVLSIGVRNRMLAAGSGVVAASGLQSSTAVALLIASFANAGLIPVSMGLAVMLGADIGSAIVASLFTLDIKRFWPLFVFLGYVLHTLHEGRSSRGKQSGRILLGIGLILLALESMGALSADLSESETILTVFNALGDEPLIAILVVATLTWIAHSSIAMLLFVAALASAGAVTEPTLISALVLGINLGGPMPAIILTLAQGLDGRRIVLGNGLFKLVASVAGLAMLPLLAALFALLPGEDGFRTVLLHIILNTCLAAVFLPFIHVVEKLLRQILADRPDAEQPEFGPLYISRESLEPMPEIALPSMVRETLRMVDLIDDMLRRSFDALESGTRTGSDEIAVLENRVDKLFDAIKAYATDQTRHYLGQSESRRAMDIVSYAASLETAGDVIEKGLSEAISKKNRLGLRFSAEGASEVREIFEFVMETSRLAAVVIMNWEIERSQELLQRKRTCKSLAVDSSERHLQRLRQGDVQSLETSGLHLDIVGDLQRINSLLAGIAYAVEKEERT